MNRRSFLSLAPAGAGLLSTLHQTTVRAAEPVALGQLPGVMSGPLAHVFEPYGCSADLGARLAKAMSDDVFERTRSAVTGPYRLTDAKPMVGVTDVDTGITLNENLNMGVIVGGYYLQKRPPVFPVDAFRSYTAASWVRGHQMMATSVDDRMPAAGLSPMEAFGSKRLVATPYLPSGLIWAAFYLDEHTGLGMRAVAGWEPARDEMLVRWDVLCG